MANELAVVGQNDPLYAATLKGYDQQEVIDMIGYMDATIAWMQSKNLHTSYQDIVMLRVGIPYCGSDTTVDANDIYLSDDNIDRLISTLSVDAIKFTVQSTNTSLALTDRAESYTYKSPYVHRIFGEYFINGVDNRTWFTNLDEFDINLSKLASIPVTYDGLLQCAPIIPFDVPDDVIHCIMYIAQNPKLVSVLGNTARELKGDVVYFASKDFFDGIVRAKYLAEQKFIEPAEFELPPSREEAIKLVLEYSEIEKAFNDLQYGGLLDGIRVLVRFPASRDMQAQLESLLSNDDNGDPEVFSDIFKEEFITNRSIDVDDSIRKDDLTDVYSTDKTDEYSTLDDSVTGNYGCERTLVLPVNDESGRTPDDPEWDPTYSTEVTYRYWFVSDEWIQKQTAEVMAIIFWLGLDIITDVETNPCPDDEILTIVIIIVMAVITVWTAGTTSTVTSVIVASAIAQGIAIASAIVAIAATIGAIDAKTAAYITTALTIFSLGTTLATGALTVGLNTATLGFVVKIANTALTVVSQIDEANYAAEMEELEKEQKMYDEEAASYEQEIRVQLGGYQDMHISNGAEFDYEKYIHDKYDRFATYEDSGFRFS